MWNWAGLLGQRPSLRRCSSCACEPADDQVLWFIREEGLLCDECVRRTAAQYTGLALGPGARRWLCAVEGRPPAHVFRMSLDGPSLAEAETFVRGLLDLPGGA
jgi:hypothetical protein